MQFKEMPGAFRKQPKAKYEVEIVSQTLYNVQACEGKTHLYFPTIDPECWYSKKKFT